MDEWSRRIALVNGSRLPHLPIWNTGTSLQPRVGAASTPPAAVLDPLSQQKAEIVALLRRGCVAWSSEDWQVFFDERASIAEFDAGLPRPQAEAHAFGCCVAEWLPQIVRNVLTLL